MQLLEWLEILRIVDRSGRHGPVHRRPMRRDLYTMAYSPGAMKAAMVERRG